MATGATMAGTRPGEGDKAVLEAAARAFAAEIAKGHKDYLGDTDAEGFSEDLLKVLPVWNDDGTELAQALHDRAGYPLDLDAIEAMGRWSDYLGLAAKDAVRAWVRATAPTAPFEGVARVSVKDGRHAGPASAYRRPDDDALARCLVVPDAERSRYLLDGGFAGGMLVPWERVVVEGPAPDEDRRAYQAMLDREARHARERAFRTFSYGVERTFEDAVKGAAPEACALSDADLAAGLAEGLAAMAADARDGRLDPFSQRAARVSAMLLAGQARALRALHARSEADLGTGVRSA